MLTEISLGGLRNQFLVTFWTLLLLPGLSFTTWQAVRKMPASRSKRYLTAFLIMGIQFWIFMACLFGMYLTAQPSLSLHTR